MGEAPKALARTAHAALTRRIYRVPLTREEVVGALTRGGAMILETPQLAGSDHREAIVLRPHEEGFEIRRHDLENPRGLRPVSRALARVALREHGDETEVELSVHVDPRRLPISTAQRLWLVVGTGMSVPLLPLIALSSIAPWAKLAALLALFGMHLGMARILQVLPRRRRDLGDAKELGALVEGTIGPLALAPPSPGFRR